MTFTLRVKDEISKEELNPIENRYMLLGYILINGRFTNDKVSILLENPSVARKLFKTLKYCYNKVAKITVRTQKKFKLKTLYILDINDKDSLIKDELSNISFDDEESKISFLKGVFLGTGSINDPKNSYHMEMHFDEASTMNLVKNLFKDFNIDFKYIKRDKKHMLYIKSGEQISDFIKLMGAVNSLFYFEDIRIYKDHKNMVNRLNNCEQANLEKTMKTSNEQVKVIKYLKEHDYFSLLDEKTQEVAEIRYKYPDESYQVLSDILSKEQEKKVTKSYVNHHLRKVNEIYNRIIEKSTNNL